MRIAWNKGIKFTHRGSFKKGNRYGQYKKTWNKGKHLSEETKKKISESNKGHVGYTKGRPLSKEHKEKLRIAGTGRHPTEETRRKLSLSLTGRKFSEETKKKMGDAKRGEKSPNWKGGIQENPYSVDWTKTLRRSIRERDKYICQICSEPQMDITHSVHHIDYDKTNCNPNNLITLCHSCHIKTNFEREKWIINFTTMMGNGKMSE